MEQQVQYHRVIREVVRNYVSLRSLCADRGDFAIEQDGVVIFLPALRGALANLSPRKKEAVFYNVILDMKQRDVAAIMGITTVSVGQYVEQAFLQVCGQIFPEFMDQPPDEEPAGVRQLPPTPPPVVSQHARFVEERAAIECVAICS